MPFARANVAHRFARLGEIGRGLAAFEVPLQVGIVEVRLASGRERVGDAQNDESSALGRIEDAGAVSEAAGLAAEFAYLAVFEVEDLDRLDRLRNFLPIGADILYRRAADAARNAAQALDARAMRHDSVRDEAVPGFSRAGVEQELCRRLSFP